MQEKLQKKLVFPLLALAIVGVAGTAYTMAHTGPTTAHAQTPTVQNPTQLGQDKETQDDVANPKLSPAASQKADANENDKADSTTNPEMEDGN